MAELEHCLGGYHRLQTYVSVLHQVVSGQTPLSGGDWLGGLSDEVIHGIEERGLNALEDATLIRLALDSTALEALGLYLAESVFTDYWMKIHAEAGRELGTGMCVL